MMANGIKVSLRNLFKPKKKFLTLIGVLEPRCNRAAWVRSGFEPQELIDVQLERQLATRYLHDVVLASTRLLYTTSFYQSLGFIAAKYRIEFLFEV